MDLLLIQVTEVTMNSWRTQRIGTTNHSWRGCCVILVLLGSMMAGLAGTGTPAPAADAAIRHTQRILPAYFIPNVPNAKGKTVAENPEVQAFVQTSQGRVLFTAGGAYIGVTAPSGPVIPPPPVSVRGMAAKPPESNRQSGSTTVFKAGFSREKNKQARPVTVSLEDKTDAVYSFFSGPAENWRSGLPAYQKLVYREVWPGIDLSFHGFMDRLEYRLLLRPGAKPEDIIMETGAERLNIDENGGLRAETGQAILHLGKPRAYQEIAGHRVDVPVVYHILDEGRYTFDPGPYQSGYPLIIDPLLRWSTLLGTNGLDANGNDSAESICIDENGYIYVTGYTISLDFPATAGTWDTSRDSSSDAFVTKLNPAGTALIYSTFLGGSGEDSGVDVTSFYGSTWVAGNTSSYDFPVTEEAYVSPNRRWNDVFVVRLDSTGSSLTFSTVIGGGDDDFAYGMAVCDGNAYVTGHTASGDFPVTAGAFDTSYNGYDAFLFRLIPDGSQLDYSTFLGGSGYDIGMDVAVNWDSCNAIVTGYSLSADFPVTSGAFSTTGNQNGSVFVTSFGNSGSSLVYSTHLGYGYGTAIATDVSMNAYVTGYTTASDFPTTAGAFDRTYNGGVDGFVTKLNPAGSALVYSTFIGGPDREEPNDLVMDGARNVYVTGLTHSTSNIASAGAFDTTRGNTPDAFVIKLNTEGSSRTFGTYLGANGYDSGHGIAVDSTGKVYVCGETQSTNFPVTAGAYDTTWNGGSRDAFVTRLNANGQSLSFSTYLGGASHGEWGRGLALDAAGNIYLAGETQSADFPVTPGVYDSSLNGATDLFVTKMNAGGASLAYSTYIGGREAETAGGLAVDAAGNAYLTGVTLSNNFPTTAGAFDQTANGEEDAFLVKLNPSGSGMVYSTYLGGTQYDFGQCVALDGAGNAYVSGRTYSSAFPVTPGAYDTSYNTSASGFVSKLNPAGSSLVYSTFLGKGLWSCEGFVVDGNGSAYLTGQTEATDFPTVPGSYDLSYNGGPNDVIVSKLNPAGSSLVYSTYFGGSLYDRPTGIAVDSSGSVYVAGWTTSANLPVTAGAFDTSSISGVDNFIVKFNPAGTELVYCTYLGTTSGSEFCSGLAIDKSGNAYVTGYTGGSDFPVTANADYPVHAGGGTDAFLSKLDARGSTLLYSTFLGGQYRDEGCGVAVDPAGYAYVTGFTESTNFPVTGGAYDTVNSSGPDVFLAKFWLDTRNYAVGGLFGAGTQSPQRALHLTGNNAVFRMDRPSDMSAFLMVRTDEFNGKLKGFLAGTEASGVNQGQFVFKDMGTSVSDGAGTARLTIENDGTVTFAGDVKAKSYITTSTVRLKENISPLGDTSEKLGLLHGVRFRWNEAAVEVSGPAGIGGIGAGDEGQAESCVNQRRDQPADLPEIGLIAEAVASVIPEAVQPGAAGGPGVDYHKLVAVVLETIKSQQARLDEIARMRDNIRRQLEKTAPGK